MSQDDWQKSVNFVNMLTSAVDVGVNTVHIALVKFSLLAEVDVYFDEGTHVDAITSAVNRLRPSHLESNPGAALALIRQEVFRITTGDRANAPDLVILVVNNPPGNRTRQIATELEMMRKQRIKVMIVGLSGGLSRQMLAVMTDPGGDGDDGDADDLYLAGDDLSDVVHQIRGGINEERAEVCVTKRGKLCLHSATTWLGNAIV